MDLPERCRHCGRPENLQGSASTLQSVSFRPVLALSPRSVSPLPVPAPPTPWSSLSLKLPTAPDPCSSWVRHFLVWWLFPPRLHRCKLFPRNQTSSTPFGSMWKLSIYNINNHILFLQIQLNHFYSHTILTLLIVENYMDSKYQLSKDPTKL